MKQPFLVIVATIALVCVAFGFQAQQGQQGQQNRQAQPAAGPPAAGARGAAAPGADPYLNNAAPGATQFPLAAPAGKDSNARQIAPSGALNQGPFDPGTWKFGTAFNPPPGTKIWNP